MSSTARPRTTRPPHRLLGLLLALLFGLLIGAPGATASSTPGDEEEGASADTTGETPDGIAWSLTPASQSGQPRVSVRAELDPGASTQDTLVLSNVGSAPATFDLYASDGIVTDAGQFDILTRDRESAAAGTWITLDQERVELDPGASVEIPFTITVPDAATPGDHPAGIVAAVAQEDSDGRVAVENRVGVRVHLRVSGEVQPALQVTDVDTRFEGSLNPFAPGRVVTSFTVENTGNVRLGAAGTVSAAGPFGLLESRSDIAEIREILPEQSMRLEEVEGDAWPLFRLGTRVNAEPLVVGSDDVAGDMASATSESSLVAIPWTQLLLLLLLVGLVLLWRRRRRGVAARRQQELDDARAEGARAAAAERESVDAVAGDAAR